MTTQLIPFLRSGRHGPGSQVPNSLAQSAAGRNGSNESPSPRPKDHSDAQWISMGKKTSGLVCPFFLGWLTGKRGTLPKKNREKGYYWATGIILYTQGAAERNKRKAFTCALLFCCGACDHDQGAVASMPSCNSSRVKERSGKEHPIQSGSKKTKTQKSTRVRRAKVLWRI